MNQKGVEFGVATDYRTFNAQVGARILEERIKVCRDERVAKAKKLGKLIVIPTWLRDRDDKAQDVEVWVDGGLEGAENLLKA